MRRVNGLRFRSVWVSRHFAGSISLRALRVGPGHDGTGQVSTAWGNFLGFLGLTLGGSRVVLSGDKQGNFRSTWLSPYLGYLEP